MADNYSRKNRLSNPGVDPSYDVYDEDPLVELARIVSEDGGYFNIADRKSQIPAAAPELEAEPEADASDLGVDLESQLLEELELSMAGPDEADYADDFGDETYLPAEEEFAAERAYAPEGAEHAYAPEDAATLARLSEFPAENAAGFTVEAPVSPVGEWADDWVEDPAGLDVAAAAPQAGEVDFAQQYEAHSLTSNESADILSENELSDLEQTLSSSEGYFSAIPAEPEAGYVDDSDEDDEFDRSLGGA